MAAYPLSLINTKMHMHAQLLSLSCIFLYLMSHIYLPLMLHYYTDAKIYHRLGSFSIIKFWLWTIRQRLKPYTYIFIQR